MSIKILHLCFNQVFCLFDISTATLLFFCFCLHKISFSILTLLGCVSWSDSCTDNIRMGLFFFYPFRYSVSFGEFSLFTFIGIIYRCGLTVAILLTAFWLFMLCTSFSCPLCDLMLFCSVPLTARITGFPVLAVLGPGSCVVFSCHISLVYFNMERLQLLMSLTFLKNTDHYGVDCSSIWVCLIFLHSRNTERIQYSVNLMHLPSACLISGW